MGQYYKIINIGTRECLLPHEYDEGSKLMEHSYVNNQLMNVIECLLETKWKNCNLIWSGDYEEPIKIKETKDKIKFITPYKINLTEEEKFDLKAKALMRVTKITLHSEIEWKNLKIGIRLERNKQYYFLNHTKKQYVDKFCCPHFIWTQKEILCPSDFAQIHPLPLLTSTGGIQGGGDYGNDGNYQDQELIGIWAGDKIEAVREIPEKYKHYQELKPKFCEDEDAEKLYQKTVLRSKLES